MKPPVLLAVLATTFGAPAVYADDSVSDDPLDIHRPGDEPNGYVAAGIVVDASNGYTSKGPVVELGQRVSDGALFARGMFQGGSMLRSDEPGFGTFGQATAGLEMRGCGHGGMVCYSGGVDAGVLKGDFDHIRFTSLGERITTNEAFLAYMVVPRVTFDAGGRIRFRAVLELPLQMRSTTTSQPTPALRAAETMQTDNTDSQFQTGVAFSLSLSVGF